jgi:hypothetical protein
MKSNYVHVYSASGQLAGDMVKLLLESMGIPAMTFQESAGITYGLTVGSLGEVKIFVPEERANEAREVLLAVDEGKINSSLYPGQFSACPEYKNNKLPRRERIK